MKKDIIGKLDEVLNNRIRDYKLVDFCEGILEIEYQDLDTENLHLSELEREILEDISAQWDLMIVNTFDENELANIDLERIKFPKEYLVFWKTELKKIVE